MNRACRYSVWFKGQAAGAGLVGTELPGVAKACEQALQAHAKIAHIKPWYVSAGWDCAFGDAQEDAVFFEGNYGLFRMPRRMLMSFRHLRTFIAALHAGRRFVKG